MFGKDKYIWKKIPRRYSSWGIYSYLMRTAFEKLTWTRKTTIISMHILERNVIGKLFDQLLRCKRC